MKSVRRVSHLVGLTVVGGFLLAGCGSNEQTTALSAQLSQIDDSLAANQFPAAKAELASLKELTNAALTKGDLSQTEANRILAAIVALESTLPIAPESAAPADASSSNLAPAQSTPIPEPAVDPTLVPTPIATPTSAADPPAPKQHDNRPTKDKGKSKPAKGK